LSQLPPLAGSQGSVCSAKVVLLLPPLLPLAALLPVIGALLPPPLPLLLLPPMLSVLPPLLSLSCCAEKQCSSSMLIDSCRKAGEASSCWYAAVYASALS
jgi:hypothetical protein